MHDEHIIRAELTRLLRRRALALTIAGTLAFAWIAALAVFSAAGDNLVVSRRGGTTIAALTGHGGATEAFAVGASFVGFLVFVTFIALVTAEFSLGTFRALLLRDPHRIRVIAGKVVGVLVIAGGALLMAEAWTTIASLVIAPTKDVTTANWSSMTSLVDAARDFATVFGGVVGWAILGTMLAIIFRSAPVALGVGFAWAGPFENIVSRSWATGYRVFPGQVLASLIQGGTAELGLGRAILTASVYVAIATAISLTLVARRDVTS